jgi:hypothetical protein
VVGGAAGREAGEVFLAEAEILAAAGHQVIGNTAIRTCQP